MSSMKLYVQKRRKSIRYRCVLAVLAGLILVLGVPDARTQSPTPSALDPSRALTQYVHDNWGVGAGLPQNTVKAILQTQEGYLWLGTEEGLARFDGVTFGSFDKSNTEALAASHNITALHEDQHGVLWIGTNGGGLVQYSSGTFTRYENEAFTSEAVSALYEDEAGNLWIGTFDQGLFVLGDSHVTHYSEDDGLSGALVRAVHQVRNGDILVGTDRGLDVITEGGIIPGHPAAQHLSDQFVMAIYEDRRHRIWVSTRNHLFQIDEEKARRFTPGVSNDIVRTMWQDGAGTLWLGMDRGGIVRLKDGQFESLSTDDGLSHARVLSIYGDREGNLWIGTEGGGLNRLRNGKFITYSTDEGLSNDMVLTVFEGDEGSLWVGTEGGGVNRIQDGTVTSYTQEDGLSNNFVSSVTGDRHGNVWVGTLGGGLNRYQNGQFLHYDRGDGLPSEIVVSLLQGRDGGLWVGTDAGLAYLKDGRFTTYDSEDGLSSNFVTALHEDGAGGLWIGTYDAGLNHLEDGRFTHFTEEDGLESDVVVALHEDGDGTVWIGTYGGGLSRLKDGEITTYTSRDGLYNENVYQILEDGSGNLWMGSNKGIFEVSKQELEAFAAGEVEAIQSTVYGEADGLLSFEVNGGVQPAGWVGQDGRIWFPTVKGVAGINPEKIRHNEVPPGVVIEGVTVDGEPVEQEKTLAEVAAGSEKLEFHFTALSLTASSRNKFRYKLEGYDDDWSEADTKRSATYTNLDPGQYTFRVMASNNDGRWNEAGAAVDLYLTPFFYERPAFWLFGTFVLACLMAGGYRARVNRLKARERELEEAVRDRTHDLRTAKEKIEAQAGELRAFNRELEQKVQDQLDTILAEREKYEQKLVREKEKAEEADRFKTAVLNNMSHEFRTPLTAVLGYAQILSMEVEEKQREFVQYIRQNGERLMNTLNAVLDLSKLESSEGQMQVRAVDLAETVPSMAGAFRSRAEKKDLAFRIDGPGERVAGRLNTEALDRIVTVLLDNAVKFTDEGEIITRYGTRGDAVFVSVQDTGRGMSKDFLPHLFEAFRQESMGDKRSHEGTGLSLTVARRLAERMNGTITVESERGEGSLFTVLFPRAHAAAGEEIDVETGGVTHLHS